MSALDPAGPSARVGAWLWWGMAGLFGLVFVVVVGLWLYATWRDPGSPGAVQARRLQQRWLIGGGLLLPIVSITAVLVVGIPLGQRMLPLPLAAGEAVRIDITAYRWRWKVSYPDDGIVLENELFIPAGQPVDLLLTSADVIHSFWVPRLGGKMDMLPGRSNRLRLEADEPGTYHGSCAEFCGAGHAHMTFTVQALAPADYQVWLEEMRRSGD